MDTPRGDDVQQRCWSSGALCISARTRRRGSTAPKAVGQVKEPWAQTTARSDATYGRVRLADRELPLAVVRERATDFAPLFARARAEVGHALCACRTPSLRLVIRSSRSGRYHLAGWPNEGELHSPDCDFHKLSGALSGRGGYSAEAIRETQGGVQIRLNAALSRRLNMPAVPARGSTSERDGRTTKSVGLLGLLHWAWEESQLNRWHACWTRRSWSTCCAELRRTLAGVRLNSEELEDVAFVIPPFSQKEAARNALAFAKFRARLARRSGTQRRGLILGEIKDVMPTPHGVRYVLARHRGALFATAALNARLQTSYRSAFSQAARLVKARCIGLFLVELSPSGNLIVVDMAAMLTSRLYIPADSSHEVMMADALCGKRRSFVKPLRYERSDAVFPDFVLTDTDPHSYVEVYGIRGREDYDRRKKIKQEFYRSSGANLFEWEIGQSMPDLHPSVRLSQR